MSVEDLEYIERITGISLDEDKPLSDLKKRSADSARASSTPKVGAVIEPPKKPEYDWFPFFLSCDVDVGLCQRYAQVFSRESMDESVLPDVDASVLRNLGLREGDIIKVMRFLDNKYGRVKKSNGDDGDGGGGLFSGPGGTLRNNTRKGRPAPAVQTSDVVDPKAFSQQREAGEGSKSSPTSATTPASSTGPSAAQKPSGGFDDDAWDVKPSKSHPSETTAPPKTQAPESAQPISPC
ncbi:hypothetical protein VTK73DRAFT_6367 [Phialemonium thermophilum]|uniref:SAM domain-containing protein n=1 Tax=Phialemonium thermophilum TaxID=223376 RepID=A0ABR3UZS1_9PEZI